MTTLSTLLGERLSPLAQETNLEQGEISVFYPGTEYSTFRCNICWKPPGNGIAVIEIWGASGSSGRTCCCGSGIPGNPGAYVKKTVNVCANSFVTGIVGISCGNASTLCWRGCSQSTCITVCHTGGCTCLCAEGGYGGWTMCTTGTSMACCLMANFGLCATSLGAGCFIVCGTPCMGRAYGGDVNCCGGWSCGTFRDCNPCCWCTFQDNVAISPGIFAKSGVVLTINRDGRGNSSAGNTGDGIYQLYGALAIAGKSGVLGGFQAACWSSGKICRCYEEAGCVPMLPYGVPGISAIAYPSERDNGTRGGHGAVRIKFIGS